MSENVRDFFSKVNGRFGFTLFDQNLFLLYNCEHDELFHLSKDVLKLHENKKNR